MFYGFPADSAEMLPEQRGEHDGSDQESDGKDKESGIIFHELRGGIADAPQESRKEEPAGR